MESRDERRLLNLQRQLARFKLVIIDELGFVPLSHTGAELLFEIFSQRYERGSILVTTYLPFDEVDRGLRVGAAHRRVAGPPHPPRAHPGNERRQLSPPGQSARHHGRVRTAGCWLAPRQARSWPSGIA